MKSVLSMALNITLAERLKKLPPYLFAAIDEMKAGGLSAIVGQMSLKREKHITESQSSQYPFAGFGWGVTSFLIAQ